MTPTRALIDHLWSITPARLDRADRAAVGNLVLDLIGVAASGAQTETATRLREGISQAYGAGGGTTPVIGGSNPMSGPLAALSNGVASHCIEYDDVHSGASSHPGSVVIPAALSACTMAGTDMPGFILAIVVGYESMCRLGRASNPASQYERHFHPTATTGHVGAAVAASRALGLTVAEAEHAVGIAVTMAGGSMGFLSGGAWTKRLHPGLAARNGIEAAVLASHGITGPEDALTGPRGFLSMFSGAPRPEALLDGMGSLDLEIHNTSIKAHACCRYKQPALDAALALRREHDLTAEDIESVTVGIPSMATGIIAEPILDKRRPGNVVDAQFSLPFGVAVALQHGRASVVEYTDEALGDEVTRALMDSVSYEVDPVLDDSYPDQWRGWATIRTRDGASYSKTIEHPKGDPANPMDETELWDKFTSITNRTYSSDRQRLIRQACSALDSTPFSDFTALLPAG